eukprot:6188453-Pleurochrysis_carterae.AAC.1
MPDRGQIWKVDNLTTFIPDSSYDSSCYHDRSQLGSTVQYRVCVCSMDMAMGIPINIRISQTIQCILL